MKKSTNYIAVTAFALTIASVFATKANRNRRPLITVGTKGDFGNACLNIQQQRYRTLNPNGVLQVARTANGFHTFFTAHFKNPIHHELGYTCQHTVFITAE